MQVASRFLLVWLIVDPFPFLAKSAGYSSMLLAWSVTEVIRYSFFTLSLSGILPKALAWLRYNTFYVLYPLGISSEVYLMYLALEPAGRLRTEYKWFIQLIMGIYVPGRSISRQSLAVVADVIRFVYIVYPHDGAETEDYAWEAGKEERLMWWEMKVKLVGALHGLATKIPSI
jgi:very-long-chain (3R)-3-hydroxyacyl-CoA dehydratase